MVEKMLALDEILVKKIEGFSNDESMWNQIVRFSGPTVGLWICGPLMSLIDTAVIGQGSSIELAALGPGTLFCDYTCYVFMFLSIATSNLVATFLAKQVVAAYMMIEALNKKGYNGIAISIPKSDKFLQIFMLAAPVFVTMTSKVAFFSLVIYFASSLGTQVVAHQVMIQVYCVCTVWGELLSQTAQSFMHEILYGTNRSLAKA
ncbi:protein DETOXIFICATION 46, chloroplastic-like [Primulina tabacum]|uniref:protein DETOXIFICATION 46, chloroplastic-like n=1 Tax=Primulina tabacum TaxID=48773 RepID=UPI003F59D108